MRWSDLPVNPSPSMLRQFAGLWIVFFGSLAAWHWAALGHSRIAAALGILAFTVGPIGLVVPTAIRPVFVAWLALAFPIGWIVSRAVLLLLFWCVMTPIALLFRLRGRDVLRLRRQPNRTTYWTPKLRVDDVRTYFRQF
jgi:hypothetical protein